jgi:hypothetical protein
MGAMGQHILPDGRLTRCTERPTRRNTAMRGAAPVAALIHYALRGYRVPRRNVWAGGYEIDSSSAGRRSVLRGEEQDGEAPRRSAEMVFRWGERLRRAAEPCRRSPRLDSLDVSFEVAAVRSGH